MNERGFFTIIGLCLLIIVAISIKGVQEFETNYSNGITNIQAEHELQNAAESALVEAVENLPKLEVNQNYTFPTKTANSEKLKNLKIEVHLQNQNLKKFIRTYISANNITDTDAGEFSENVMLIISVASCDNPFIDGKMYHSSFAYIDDDKTVHYLNNR